MPKHLAILLFAFTADAAEFVSHEIATGLKGGYQVIAVDLNRDGKPDLIAVAPGTNELVWFENPSWQKHVILANVPRMINCAAWDVDGDGIPELALAYEFSNDARKSTGIVVILHHNGDPAQPWTPTEIDRLPTSHRLRWADIRGNGKKVLINAPLTNAEAQKPDDHLPVPLVYYDPADWKRHVISEENQGVQHGIFVSRWDGQKRESILTASFSGLHVHSFQQDGTWLRTKLTGGSPEPWPKSGSSDVAVGFLGKQRFLAAIEPWHGNQVAVYRQHAGHWARKVIDSALVDGHTIAAADFDGDGNHSVLAGARAGTRSLYLYKSDRKTTQGKWIRQFIDEGNMAAAACAVADLNNDGRLDFACISPVSQNLKWYENTSANKNRGAAPN